MSLAVFPLGSIDRRAIPKLTWLAVILVLLTLGIDSVAIKLGGPNSPTGGDGPYFISIARSLAAGHGYAMETGLWPGQPNVGRQPVWPFFLSIAVRLFPSANDNLLLRACGAVLHALSAAMVVLLTFQLTGRIGAAGLSGLVMAVYPSALSNVLSGYSETAFVALLGISVVLILEGGWLIYLGAIVMGLGILTRASYIILPVLLILLAFIVWKSRILKRGTRWPMVVAAVLTYLFPAIWVARNYAVTGRFPLLSGLQGETLYGSNNDRVANDLSVWGYWIFPDEIPGEQTKRALSAGRTEIEVDEYYQIKANRFLRANWKSMPRLIVGKLIRGFVPIPWVPLTSSYVAFFCRAVVFAAFLYVVFRVGIINQPYGILLLSVFLVTLITTVIYYGTYRFTFCLEVLLLPPIAAAAFPGREAPCIQKGPCRLGGQAR